MLCHTSITFLVGSVILRHGVGNCDDSVCSTKTVSLMQMKSFDSLGMRGIANQQVSASVGSTSHHTSNVPQFPPGTGDTLWTLLTTWSGAPHEEVAISRSKGVQSFIRKFKAWSRKKQSPVLASINCSNLTGHPNLSGIELVPKNAPSDRVVLYFHGGAYVMFTPNVYKYYLSALALAFPARYVAVDYRKAPEYPFPAGLDDALETYRWTRKRFPNAKIAIAGDSAGGNLAFALLVRLAQLNEPMPDACVGISPWLMLDVTKAAEFHKRSWTENLWFWSFAQLLLKWDLDTMMRNKMHDLIAAMHFQDHDCKDPLITPLYAEEKVVAKFPPVLIQGGENESIKHDCQAMVDLCRRAGVRAELQLYPNAGHAFQVYGGPGTNESIVDIGNFLNSTLS